MQIAGMSAASAPRSSVSFAQMNVWNFFDTVDNPHTADKVYDKDQYAARVAKVSKLIASDLGAPDIIALEEIENARVLKALVAAPDMAKLGYRYLMSDRDDERGIRIGMLYRADHVKPTKVSYLNTPTTLPPEDPKPDNMLFSRSPILATFQQLGKTDAAVGASFTVIANHFKSKLGGDYYEPRRQAQGEFIGNTVDSIRRSNPNEPIIVLGDFNAGYADGAYTKMAKRADGTARLVDTVEGLPDADRYTYNYRGKLDLLDHLMVTPELAGAVTGARILHINTDKESVKLRFDPTTVRGTSDHDPMVATITFGAKKS